MQLLEVRNSEDPREVLGWLLHGSDLLPLAMVSDQVSGGEHKEKWRVFSSNGKTFEELKKLPGFVPVQQRLEELL